MAALAWQVLWVAIFVKVGATLFRRTVLKSGGAGRMRDTERKGLLAMLGLAKLGILSNRS